MILRDLAVAAVLAAVLAAATTAAQARAGDYRCAAAGVPGAYDPFFTLAARKHYPPALRAHWCVAKALCWIESRLNPLAASGAGAQGLCQVMPATAAGLRRRGAWRGRLRSAKDNAEASAIVFARYWAVWATPRTIECRTELTLASYNAGPGSIIKAQVEAGGALCWERIRAALPRVTGRHARETIDYVDRFWAAWRRLRGYGL